MRMDQSFASQRVFINPQAKNWIRIYSKKSLSDGLNPRFIGQSNPDHAWEWHPNKTSTGLWAG
jgi:hypothetical protein